jgi:hypothetical protein
MHIANLCSPYKITIHISYKGQKANLAGSSSLGAGNVGGQIIIRG